MSDKNGMDMKPVLIKELFKDENGHPIWVAKCPYCNNFFTARKSNIKNAHTKSCGCLRIIKAQKMGLSNKKYNVLYQPLNCDYIIVYSLDGKNKFIISETERAKIKKHTWYYQNRKNGKVDAFTYIDGKKIYMHDYLNNTDVKNGEQCDHINQEPRDNRDCNTRNCTLNMNLLNTERMKDKSGELIEQDGKFIVKFPCIGEKTFNTKEDAEKEYNKTYEFTYNCSQEIAREIETYEFSKKFYYYGGVLEEIDNLPEINIYKRWLKNIENWFLTGKITEEQAEILLLRHIDEYKKFKKEDKTA